MRIIINDFKSKHASNDTVVEFLNSIRECESEIEITSISELISKYSNRLHKFAKTFHFNRIIEIAFRQLYFKSDFFTILMGYNIRCFFPHFLSNRKKHLYLFDAWPDSHQEVIQAANEFKISTIFVSSYQATEQLKKYDTSCKFHYVPEGIRVEDYVYRPYSSKNIDVLQIGRKHDLYHNKIVRFCEQNSITYYYEKEKGKLIFPSKASFLDGLSRAKISICFPSNVTHPLRSGGIETMTNRYLQSMASKCLILGHAPQEMIQLFGYNPIVEVDIENSSQQLQYILDNYNDYADLIHKNFVNVKSHTWNARWVQIKELLNLN